MIESIRPRNLLSFGPDTKALPLGPLNVLIGANGSGKSNLLEAVGLLQAAPRDLAVPMRRENVADWLWQGESRASSAGIEVVVQPDQEEALRYVLEFGESEGRLEVVREEVRPSSRRRHPFLESDGNRAIVRRKGGRPRGAVVQPVDSTRSALPQTEHWQHPQLAACRRTLKAISLYRNFHLADGVRHSPSADLPSGRLMDDCSNLGLVLNELAQDRDAKQRLVEALQELSEDALDFHVGLEGGVVQIAFLERRGNVALRSVRPSGGTIRHLGLLAILCHPSPPPLVCIEHPEAGLHPDLHFRLVRLPARSIGTIPVDRDDARRGGGGWADRRAGAHSGVREGGREHEV